MLLCFSSVYLFILLTKTYEQFLEKEMATHSILPGGSHGQRSLAWGHEESDTTEQLKVHSLTLPMCQELLLLLGPAMKNVPALLGGLTLNKSVKQQLLGASRLITE